MNKAISIMRVAAMLFIVFYHCVCYYGIWKFFPEHTTYDSIEYWRSACNFALNAFVFISGFLFASLYIKKGKYRNKKEFLKNKGLRLLLPYIFWAVIAWVLIPAVQPFSDILCGMQHLWFLLMLFGIFGISILTIDKLLNIGMLLQGGVILAILIVYQPISKHDTFGIPNYFGWCSIVRYLPAFLIGIMTVQHHCASRLARCNALFLGIITIVTLLLVIFMAVAPVLPLGLIYMNLPSYMLLILVYALLSKTADNTTPLSAWGRSLDACSLGIYIIHHILIWLVLFYVPQIHSLLNEYIILAPIAMFITVLSVSWCIASLLRKNKTTSIFIGA